ncbi:MAG: Tex family protein [Pseudomonadota bacterium]
MQETHIAAVAASLQITADQVRAVAHLISDGASVPFISRYRKEATGSLDEVAVTAIRDHLKRLADLDTRKSAVIASLTQHGHFTAELETAVAAAETLAAVEDIYLPYRPKRRTRATIAREKGLAPLAELIMAQTGVDPAQAAVGAVDPERGVQDVADALAGARDIIAETVNESASARDALRRLFMEKATLSSRVSEGKEAEGAKYRDYFEWSEPASTAPSHRVLAMRRGEREEILMLTIQPDETAAIALLERLFVIGDGPDSAQVRLAVTDSYRRLLSRSMETEARLATKEAADREAIRVFADNLRHLLLAPPLGAKRIMGIDPGFRTGCKVVCLDRQGKLLHHETIYPHTGSGGAQKAVDTLKDLIRKNDIEAIAVGNGTAGRETEQFVRGALAPSELPVVSVNESGASIYSASETARKEFPDLDLTVRGSISIARRLMDPLAELVKIDPKSIGVGQYQHDVDQGALKETLDDVVVSCVNAVGVDLNRASAALLAYVSGIGERLAANIVDTRNANGPFACRHDLLKVPRLGPKAFEQAAGFLRIPNGTTPLDASAVHPESYPVVEAMARNLDCTVADLMTSRDIRERIALDDYVTDTVGLPTLQDILSELAKPGRDPRAGFSAVTFADNITRMEDLNPGMVLTGVVTNVTQFGAFVDIGVHQDGLVHISQLADRFVKDPADVVKVSQAVRVTVLEVDLARKRISLSMKTDAVKSLAAGGTSPTRHKPVKKQAAKPDRNRPPKPVQKESAAPFNNPFSGLGDKLNAGGDKA